MPRFGQGEDQQMQKDGQSENKHKIETGKKQEKKPTWISVNLDTRTKIFHKEKHDH